MPCYGPMTAFYPKRLLRNGDPNPDRRLVFRKDKSETGIAIGIPCGRCLGCRLERSRQWAVRCMHEAKMWEDKCFITLTYSNENLPEGNNLSKRDFQLFMKRLRDVRGYNNGVRYYACGEYGETTKRPHYHALLFNVAFRDRKFHSENKRGDKLYTSPELRTLWPQGHNVIGEVTFDTAQYVAGYVHKKVVGEKADEYYSYYDSEGRLCQREREFSLMSRRPGIGAAYYEKYGAEVRSHDSVIVNGKEAPGTRFYDARSGLYDSPVSGSLRTVGFAKTKRLRRLEAFKRKADNTSRRRWVKEQVALARLAQKKGSL